MLKKVFFSYLILVAFIATASTFDENNVGVVSLSPKVQYDYELPEDYKNKKLKFEGNYKRYTKAIYRKSKNEIRFVPIRVGQGVLIIKDTKNKILKQITVDVNKSNLHKIAKEVSGLLRAVDGIEIKLLNNRVVIDGEILLPRDMDRILKVVAYYQNKQVVSLVTFSPKAQRQISALIEKEIGLPDVQVRAAYNRFILEGTVNNEGEKQKAEIIANLYTQFDTGASRDTVSNKSINSVTNLIKVREQKEAPPKPLVRVVVNYVELHKSFNRGFSFQWAPLIGSNETYATVSAGGPTPGLTGVLTSTISNFFPKLNWAKSFNFAKILHTSNVILEVGKTANIEAGTTIPITQTTAEGTITTRSTSSLVATTVKIPKIIEETNTFIMNITFKVSSPVGSSASGGLTSNKSINTEIYIVDRKTAALGGLVSSSLSRDYNRLPGSATDTQPIINLLSSKNYDATKSQFVVFVTPTKHSDGTVGTKQILRKFKLDQE